MPNTTDEHRRHTRHSDTYRVEIGHVLQHEPEVVNAANHLLALRSFVSDKVGDAMSSLADGADTLQSLPDFLERRGLHVGILAVVVRRGGVRSGRMSINHQPFLSGRHGSG